MDFFSNLAQEKNVIDITKHLKTPLHERINQRGSSEQFSAILRPYIKNAPKRKCKGTFTKGCEFFSKYNA